jgi:quercetin dioxygenase-like cupin family protein
MRLTEPPRSPRRQGLTDQQTCLPAGIRGMDLQGRLSQRRESRKAPSAMSERTSGIIQQAGVDEPILMRLRGEDSEGHLAVIEMSLTPNGHAPPLHVHPTHGEGFLVLSGVLSFQLGDQVITGGPGTWAFAPRNVPHTLANLGDREGRLLVVCTPAGFERFFDRMIAKRRGEAFGEPRTEAERLTRAVGPPLSALQ